MLLLLIVTAFIASSQDGNSKKKQIGAIKSHIESTNHRLHSSQIQYERALRKLSQYQASPDSQLAALDVNRLAELKAKVAAQENVLATNKKRAAELSAQLRMLENVNLRSGSLLKCT